MDNEPVSVPWRFKRPPYFLVLIVLVAAIGVYFFGRMWVKSWQIPSVSADGAPGWEQRIDQTSNVQELRRMAKVSGERAIRAERMADSSFALVRKSCRSALLVSAVVLFCTISLYLEKRWR